MSARTLAGAYPSIGANYAERDRLLDLVDAATNRKSCRDGTAWVPVAWEDAPRVPPHAGPTATNPNAERSAVRRTYPTRRVGGRGPGWG